MAAQQWFRVALLLVATACALRYDPSQVAYNVNTNQSAVDPTSYWGEWEGHNFHPSPSNWRLPFYTILLDRFANGNPTNDDANGTQFEHDLTQTQLRHGGDIKGLQDSLDYLQGMGIKVLYLAGSPHINVPWAADGYSPLDLTLLDHHFGTIAEWQATIAEIHQRGMYIILDNTMSTMGDLIGFEGYLNVSTPFNRMEHNALWKGDRRYNDFAFGNNELPHCDYPRFYGDDGKQVLNLSSELVGCRDSEFDQYGEVAAFGIYPEWQRQLSKFAFVQDRLREWRPGVLSKLERFSCMTLAMLDIDGYRIDKGLTITVDAQAHWSNSIRACAKRFGKQNFYISGEVVAGNTFGSVYVGRGRTPDNYVENVTEAVVLTDKSKPQYFIRESGLSAFDGVAFHYTVYRFLSRFLGLDGTFGAEGDPPSVSWLDFWETILSTNDMINANDGITFDPRHMYGVTNQDVFRWPTIKNGIEKQMLGYFIVALLLPGIPTLVWGEEQAFYVLDSTNANYVFGRSPMSSAQAWGMHGCYNAAIGNSKYNQWPIEAGLHGCRDEWVNLDHRDPSHPVRNFVKSTHEMRETYPVFQDGFSLQLLSKQTYEIFLPGSNKTPTETGLWSIERAGNIVIQQNLTQVAWLVYTNENHTTDMTFNCKEDDGSALIAPFSAGSVVKNTYFPYEEYKLTESNKAMGGKPGQFMGCLPRLQLPAWGFKAFVLKKEYLEPSPVITAFLPGHDSRILSTGLIPIELHFSAPMDCQQITNGLIIVSTTSDSSTPRLDARSVRCNNISNSDSTLSFISGTTNTTWSFAANLTDVADGIHQISIKNISTAADRNATTNSYDHFLLRVGQSDNPMVFPSSANYSKNLLFKDPDNNLYVSHKAAGADSFRYSLNFGTTYSDWESYSSAGTFNTTLAPKVWSGTKLQSWNGEHVMVQYWSRLAGSSDHVQHADLGISSHQRQFPNVFLEGVFNRHGYDGGVANQMQMRNNNIWSFDFVNEWPTQVSVNLWGMNPDGQPDQTRVYGDIDGDLVLDRIPPYSLINNVINITDPPPPPFLGWRITLNDADYRIQLTPIGSRWNQLVLYLFLWLIPILTGAAAVWVFVTSFYGVKLNEFGIASQKGLKIRGLGQLFKRKKVQGLEDVSNESHFSPTKPSDIGIAHEFRQAKQFVQVATPVTPTIPKRLTVLIATMEYEIEDWAIKVKIGGLGVMSSLMGKNLKHQSLIWVIPCIGGIRYPVDRRAESIAIKVLGSMYEIKTQYHTVDNITYVLLDAPIFRQQTKAEPYPARMDDLDSAVYYSAWNSCIAEIMRRFPIDLYHINDYHGAVAPLHLLPKVLPCLLSLHNAEFQGLWPMRSEAESREVCDIYNLDSAVVQKYVRFGEVFNLLHAGASYLRIHQKGFGAVGVSTKYGKRAFARYPIFWGMRDVGGLPNPDPTDTGSWSGEQIKTQEISVDKKLEDSRPKEKRLAQNWAGLKQDPEAELFVFVGRWSNQKGVDAIADIFPAIMERHSHVQLICVGPVIDLYGRFAAIKLERMMKVYPGRVFSNPEFMALPPYVFSGADFALMPSRDEPFGLVAVEFGRKGVLCVGGFSSCLPWVIIRARIARTALLIHLSFYRLAFRKGRDDADSGLRAGARVGGLGNMPGWWFTIESTTTRHFIQQFKTAVENALRSKADVRAIMRARATKQRFPVSQWVEDLEKLQSSAIEISHKQAAREKRPTFDTPNTPTVLETPNLLSMLQPRVPPSRRPRPAVLQATKQGKVLGTISETRPRSGTSQASDPSRIPTSFSEGQLFSRSSPGLGSKIGPSSRRKAPPTLVLNKQPKTITRSDITAFRSEAYKARRDDNQRPPMPRAPSSPNIHTRPKLSERENSERGKRPEPRRSQTMPQLQANDRKAVRLMGMQLSSSQASALTSPKYPPESSNESSSQPPSTPKTPVPPRTAYYTPPSTPTSLPSRMSGHRVSYFTSSTAPTSVSGDSSISGDTSDSATISMSAGTSSISANRVNATKSRNTHPAQAPDSFPNLEPDHILQGAIPILSTSDIKGGKSDNILTNVTPFFTDPDKKYETKFKTKLKALNGKNSEHGLCIEEFLLQSEKSWFTKLRAAELSKKVEAKAPEQREKIREEKRQDEFGLGDNYRPPAGLKRILRMKSGDWPVYSFLLAFGQIIAANSYQITLLTGTVGESANKLYIIASIYFATSLGWWLLYRRLQTVYVVSLPFFFYGLAFFFLGISPLARHSSTTDWLHNAATGLYSLASASGAIYFAVNFADEGGAPVTSFVYRACVIQGTQQIYVVALWYWGDALAKAQGTISVVANLNSYPKIILPVCIIVAFLMWSVGVVLFIGLPNYYRQAPGHIPAFYPSLFRRKIIIWFFVVVVIQNYFLSTPYGRNWLYLWSNQAVPAWQIVILIIVFFIGIWIVFLYIFSHLSKSHSWVLPVFAMGLGAPRWAQILWSTSSMGHYLPWTAGPIASGLAGRALWLWLGVLDAVQGVGFGMILLQTLTRFHVLFTLIAAQMLGSLTTIVARTSAPDKLGPASVFPDLCVNPREGLRSGWFWVALLLQLAVPIGFGAFFRKEQLSKA